MKFFYEYRTGDNIPHQGVIVASTKEAAYATLKSRGVRPGKVWEAPGFLNKLLGKGKRWTVIVVLLILFVAAFVFSISLLQRTREIAKEIEDVSLYEERGQIYGPAIVLSEMEADCYSSVFSNDIDRCLACYAIPGRAISDNDLSLPLDVSPRSLAAVVRIDESDLDEVKRLKRMVNGMRREMQEYLEDGGTVSGYMQRLRIRQKAEVSILERTRRLLLQTHDQEVWKRSNSQLRAKGLPMVEPLVAD